jgi:hypothetical protein
MLDSDLTKLYGVTTKRLNEQVKRNRERFPADFMLQLTSGEATNLRSQIATSKLIASTKRASTLWTLTWSSKIMMPSGGGNRGGRGYVLHLGGAAAGGVECGLDF